MTLTLRKNQVHYTGVMHAVMSLQFTQVHNFHAKAGRETGKRIFMVGFYCVTITWQQIFKASL